MVIMDTNLKNRAGTKSTLTIRDSSKFKTENLMGNFTPPILEMDVILSQAYNQFNTEFQKNPRCSGTKEDHKTNC